MSEKRKKQERQKLRSSKPPALSTRELIRLLLAHGAEELHGRGKGAHRMFQRHVDGRRYATTVPSDSRSIALGTLKSIRRGLKLDEMPDDEFYGA